MDVAQLKTLPQFNLKFGIPSERKVEIRYKALIDITSKVRLDNKPFHVNFLKFAEMFDIFKLPLVGSFMHAFCKSNAITDAPLPGAHLWPTSIYEDIYKIKVNKYFANVPCCGHPDILSTIPIYKEIGQKGTTKLKKSQGQPCDIFYGVGMTKISNLGTITSCINVLLHIISLGLRYSKDIIMISFSPFKHCSDIITLMAHHFDIKVYVTFFAQNFVIYFRNNKTQGAKLQTTIEWLLKETKNKNITSMFSTTPIEIEHLLSDIRYQIHMDRQQTHINRCVRLLLKCHKHVECELLLSEFFTPLTNKRYKLGPATVIDGESKFFETYLKQYHDPNFVFISIDLQKSIGRFYVQYMQYKYICIHHLTIDPKMFLKIYSTEIKFNILVENDSFLFIERLN